MAVSNISEFLQLVKKNHIARTNRFKITIILPEKLREALGSDENANKVEKQISLSCLMTDIPGSQEQTTTTGYGGYNRKVAYTRTLNDFSTSLIVLGNFTEKRIFDAWNNIIMADSNNIAGYYDDYVTSILLEVLNDKDETVYLVQIFEAYPTIVSSLKLDRTAQNQQMIIDVNWAYHKIIYFNSASSIATDRTVKAVPGVADASLNGKKRLLAVPGIDSLSSGIQGAMNTVKEFRGQVQGVLAITKDVREQVRDFKMQVVDGVKVLNGVVKDIREIRSVPLQVRNELQAVVNDTKNQLGSLKNDSKLIGKSFPTR